MSRFHIFTSLFESRLSIFSMSTLELCDHWLFYLRERQWSLWPFSSLDYSRFHSHYGQRGKNVSESRGRNCISLSGHTDPYLLHLAKCEVSHGYIRVCLEKFTSVPSNGNNWCWQHSFFPSLLKPVYFSSIPFLTVSLLESSHIFTDILLGNHPNASIAEDFSVPILEQELVPRGIS